MSPYESNATVAEIQALLTRDVCEVNQWAHFSKWDSPLNAEHFVQTLVLGWLKKQQASLNELAQMAGDLGIEVSGAAIHERMKPSAVVLMAGVMQMALVRWQMRCPLSLTRLQAFSAICVTDSSQISLPAELQTIFRGNQSDNSQLKIQVVWDYLHGNLLAMEVVEGRSPDQNCDLPVRCAQVGSLQLFDLGYFKQERLHDINEQKAFFVCRYQSQTAVYSLDEQQRIDLVGWLKTLQSNEVEMRLCLGGRVKLPIRLLARRLAPLAAQARRRKAQQKAGKQGKTCSDVYRFLLGWDILLTNLAEEQWCLPEVFDLYPIRFQIEWLFRTWKDQLGVDVIGSWKVERVLCQLYAHLLGALLTHHLTQSWRWNDVEYSFHKTAQIVQAHMHGLMRCLARSGWGLVAWLKSLEDDFRRYARKNLRRKSPSTAQTIHNWATS